MTETSPLAALALPPRGTPPEREIDFLSKTGRVVAGVEMRLAGASDEILPWDGKSVGEIEVRGPWIAGSYFGEETPEKFHEGWLRTGDVGTIDETGFVQISDRAKDVIKSGGEWISSVDLEGQLMAHPDVTEAGVIGVPDERWDERPLACVVLKQGSTLSVYVLYPNMNVAQNISFSAWRCAGCPSPSATRRWPRPRAPCRSSTCSNVSREQLSGGQRQRVAMGRAIVREPQVFLFDEPLSNLDAKLRDEMRVEIPSSTQRVTTTIIYVTHDQVEAMTLADRIVVMNEGG